MPETSTFSINISHYYFIVHICCYYQTPGTVHDTEEMGKTEKVTQCLSLEILLSNR